MNKGTKQMKSDAELITLAEKAIPIAERHTAVELQRHIENLRRNPNNRDSRFRLESGTNAAWYLKQVKTYGRD
jgi:hypothetical protein